MYTIKVLSDEDFERLPYSRVPEALGVADPKINTAFVRYTVSHDLNKYLIDHEFEHLIEEVPTDEIDGVRYKIPVVGPAFYAVSSVAKPVFSGLGKVASTIGSGVKSVFGTGANALSQFSSSALPQSANLYSGPGSNVSFGGGSFRPPPTPTGGPGPSASTSPLSKITNNFNSVKSAVQPYQDLYKQGKQAFDFGKEAYDQISSFFGGGKKEAEIDQSPYVQQLNSQLQAGGSPLGQQGQAVLQGQLGQQFEPLSEPEIEAALRQLEKDQLNAEDRVRDLYRNLRPGTDPSTDSAFRRDLSEVSDQFSRAKADLLANRTRDIKTQFDTRKLQEVQTAIGASNTEMATLLELAKLDVAAIQEKTGWDMLTALLFQQEFGGV